MAALVAAGKDVLLPLGQRRYDMAYEEEGRLVKVQCKSGLLKDGALSFRTHSVGRRSLRDYIGEVNYFGVYCHERREVYLVPIEDVPRSRACLRLTPPRNGQSTGIRLASQYVLRSQDDPSEPSRSMSQLKGALPLQLPVLNEAPSAESPGNAGSPPR